MKHKILMCLVSLVLTWGYTHAQLSPTRYFIQFTDKNNTPYSLSNPTEFLTQRAIDRRYTQNIPIDSTDLPVNPAYIDSVLSQGAVNLIHTSRWLNGITIQTTDTTALSAINNLNFVKQSIYVAPRYASNRDVHHFSKDYVPAPQQSIKYKYPQSKGVQAYNYGFAFNQIDMIKANNLHSQGYSGESMVIAVLDAGFSKVDSLVIFDSLRVSGRLLGTKNFVNPGGNVFQAHAHGMMVLSTMAAHISTQMVGIAPKASYWLLKTEYAPTEYVIEEYNWVSAAEFADSVGVDIINSSLGYSEFDDPTQNHTFADLDGHTTTVSQGANMAASKGILVVNSAGNSALTPWQRIIAPADAPGVLSVGSVNYDNLYSAFSSVGPSADGRIKPDVAAQGEGTVVAGTSNNIIVSSGTSFSAPLIAGAAACLWQANPTATNWEIMDAIRESAHQYQNPDSLLGYGIPDFAAAHAILNGVYTVNTIKENALKIYPNPFKNSLHVLYNAMNHDIININIYDISGRLVHQMIGHPLHEGRNYIEMKFLSNFSDGFYFIHLQTSTNDYRKKIVKSS